MKVIFTAVLALFLAMSFSLAFAADPVDLSGKKGVVDPKDLKKYDPKPPKLTTNPPPPPKTDNSGKASKTK
jgi:hypothetical protein